MANFISVPGFMLTYSSSDPYREFMWEAFGNGGYEPTTVGFLIANCKTDTTFIDVGASSGMLSLIAARLGARVIAIEPQTLYFDALQENVGLNDLGEVVIPLKIGVSNYNSDDGLAGKKVFHHSVFNKERLQEERVAIRKMSDLILDFENEHEHCILKIDIEGAEYAILKDPNEASIIRNKVKRLFLALHPGFPYEHEFRGWASWLVMAVNSKLRGLFDSSRVYKNLNGKMTCSLPNGRRVHRRWEFLMLTLLGAHDWVFDFKR